MTEPHVISTTLEGDAVQMGLLLVSQAILPVARTIADEEQRLQLLTAVICHVLSTVSLNYGHALATAIFIKGLQAAQELMQGLDPGAGASAGAH
jgi:hypothetical protein